ncbi:MAG: DUF354 domain-containing protein [bacterium]
MKILIDINHPAHVHYFKNIIKIMESKGHSFVVVNRDDAIINKLLDIYNIKHFTRNKRNTKKSTIRGILYLLNMIRYIIKKSITEKPDMYLGFASSACAVVAFLFREKSIILDDTEHNKMNHAIYTRFCSEIYTPFYFEKKLGKKQNYFDAYIEQLYLRSNYYHNDTAVLSELGLQQYNYILVRYISYDAQHDKYVKPISEMMKKQIITELSQKYKVIVSCESSVVDDFYKQYMFKISPDKMHNLIANAKYFISEGATMACEAGILGTPYLYMNPLSVGNINTQVKNYKHASQCVDEDIILNVIDQNLQTTFNEPQRNQLVKEIESTTIDPTLMLENIISK